MHATKKTAIRCGSCKGTHATVAEVRECFELAKEPPATMKQVSYCQSLLRQREPTAEFAELTEDRINSFSKKDAIYFIDAMKVQPYREKKFHILEIPHPEVPEGYYAAIVNKDGVIDFYKLVDWKDDQRLLFQVFGAPGSFKETKVTRPEHAQLVMDIIAADPKEASTLFGKELGVCGRCGSPLTSKWRKLGIGPVCVSKEW